MNNHPKPQMISSAEAQYEVGQYRSKALVADYGSEVAVLLTHPWGLLGGDMHNNVVARLAFYFQKIQVTTMRLNFSGSQLGTGAREVEEVVDAANFLLGGYYQTAGNLQREVNTETMKGSAPASLSDNSPPRTSTQERRPQQLPSGILLIGYSYGALIAASASGRIAQCLGVVTIAPPIAYANWLLIFNADRHAALAQRRKQLPRLMIQGSKDNFTSTSDFEKSASSYPKAHTVSVVISNADHFFSRREGEIAEEIEKWLLGKFPSLEGTLANLGKIDLYSIMRVGCVTSSNVKNIEQDGSICEFKNYESVGYDDIKSLLKCENRCHLVM